MKFEKSSFFFFLLKQGNSAGTGVLTSCFFDVQKITVIKMSKNLWEEKTQTQTLIMWLFSLTQQQLQEKTSPSCFFMSLHYVVLIKFSLSTFQNIK